MKHHQPILLLSDARGVYIPRDFVREVKPECISGLKDGDRMILETGPDHEWYWEAWECVLDNVTVTDPTSGIKYRVYQDGDCWLLPEGMAVSDSGEFTYGE